MKKTLLSTLAVAVLLCSAGRAIAQTDANQMKPILIVSLAGYQKIIDDLDFIGKVSDNPDLAKHLEGAISFFTNQQDLAGLDKSKPWGLAISTDGLSFQAITFIPVSSAKEFLGNFAAFLGEPRLEEGMFKVQAPAMPFPIYVKEQNGYAFIGQDAAGLQNLPQDPTTLLAGLDKQYDIAIRLGVQNIPEVFRQLAIDQFRMGVEGNLHPAADESDEEFEQRSKLTRQQLDLMVAAINDLDQLTFGWSIDQTARRTYLDLSVTAVEGSKTAKQMADLPAPPSRFGGFLQPEAVATMHINTKSTPENSTQAISMLRSAKSQIESEIDKEESLNAETRAGYKDAMADVMSALEETIKAGVINGGAIAVGEGPFTLVAGGLSADGAKLEQAVMKMIDTAKKDPRFSADGLKLNADSYEGLTFHTYSMPIPGDDEHAEKAKRVLGDNLILTGAFGKDSAYIAIGEKGVETIKQVVDKSKGVTEATSKPTEITVALAPIMKFISSVEGDNPLLAALAGNLQESGNDHIRLTQEMIPNGTTYRLQAEEGVLKLLGSAAKQATAQGGLQSF